MLIPKPVLINGSNGIQSTQASQNGQSQLIRSTSIDGHEHSNGHIDPKTADPSSSLPPQPKQIGRDTSKTESQQNWAAFEATDDGSRPKFCLREKKRQRKQENAVVVEKNRWRNSTTSILDDVYRDIAKGIPTIDDVRAFLVH